MIPCFLNLPLWLTIPAIIISGLYFLLIFSFYFGWKKIPEFLPEKLTSTEKISVIIAFRNEEAHLPDLIEDLVVQIFPKQSFEVILIDDHSVDMSYDLVKSLIKDLQGFVLLTSNSQGKKQALHTGLEFCTGSLVVTTDADCRMDSEWLSSISAYYQDRRPEMILGPVLPLRVKGFFNQLLSLEFFSLIASAAGSAGLGHAVLCNGANMAYRKGALDNLDDPFMQTVASGDDIFLLQSLKRKKSSGICFLKSTEAIVKTHIPSTIKEFWLQRVRWASKTKVYTDWDMKITGFLVFLMNISIVLSLFATLYQSNLIFLYLLLIIIKSIPDFLLLRSVLRFYKRKDLLKYFIPLQFVYPFYVNFVGFLGFFASKYTWKGRQF